MVAALLAGFCAALLLAASATADGRDAALADYNATQADARVPAGWTGSTDPCTVGAESQASLDATLNTLNILRRFADIEPVTFNTEKNHRALSAALMMRAQGDLSHNPPPSWKCWTEEGRLGASTSNLYLGASGAKAMVGFVKDAGIESLGHRRWVLDPAAVEMGSGSTGSSNALVVIGSGGDGSRAAALPADKLVAWPSPGWFPATWIFEDWSVAIGSPQSEGTVSLADAQVKVKVDGKSAGVSGVREASPGEPFGTGVTLTWQVALPSTMAQGDHEISVEVSGVTIAGAPLPIDYTVQAFDPASSTATGDSTACVKAKAKVKRAMKKLKKAQRGGGQKKIKAAKKKLKKAKAKKRKAC